MVCFINDLPIYYQECGLGKPMLCIHGFPEDHRTMTGCMEPIFKHIDGYRRIYLDLPGMGKTPAGNFVKNADDMLELLKEFIVKIIGTENFLVARVSYGSYLSLGLAHELSAQIEGMFLICPCVITDHGRRNLPPACNLYIEQGLEDEVYTPSDYHGFLEYAVIANKETWSRYQNEVLLGLNAADTNFVEIYQANGYGFSFESELKTLQFDKPIGVLTGKQDNCVGYEDAWELLKNLPRLTFSVLDGAGHNLQLEKPELFNLHVGNWLKTVSEFI